LLYKRVVLLGLCIVTMATSFGLR